MNLEDIREYGNLELLARLLVDGFITGKHKSPYHGFSVEFAEHRNYNPGDSTRYIDWKVFAKTDRLYTKRFDEETNLRCVLAIDISSSMYFPVDTNDKIRFSTIAAASLANLLQRQRDAFGICLFNETIDYLSPIKSTSIHLHNSLIKLDEILNKKSVNVTSNLPYVLHTLAEQVHKRSMIVLFTDFLGEDKRMDELFNGLQHLKHSQHDIILFHVWDSEQEELLELEDRPYLLTDAETGDRLKIYPHEIKKEYAQKVQQYFHDLKMRCGDYGIEFIEADIRKDFDQVFVPFLLKRNSL
jgi:uncharacterized protein (DUF58 family)